jgi:hypothetical protein
MKRPWLIFEALALTLPATLLLAAGLPIAVRSTLFMGEVAASDPRAVIESVLALLPYLCGLFAWVMVWRGVFEVYAGGHLRPGGWFWAVAAAGFVASFDFLLQSPQLARLLVCAPVWALAAHLMLLGLHPQTQRGPQLA